MEPLAVVQSEIECIVKAVDVIRNNSYIVSLAYSCYCETISNIYTLG